MEQEPAAEFEHEKRLDDLDPVSEREIDVLQQMAYGRKNREIAKILHISHNTVKTHVHPYFTKVRCRGSHPGRSVCDTPRDR
jgi:DNA-binding NarL/FixJ family response regulator